MAKPMADEHKNADLNAHDARLLRIGMETPWYFELVANDQREIRGCEAARRVQSKYESVRFKLRLLIATCSQHAKALVAHAPLLQASTCNKSTSRATGELSKRTAGGA
jgi:hypothetical protein